MYKDIVIFFARDFDIFFLCTFFLFEFIHKGHMVSVVSLKVRHSRHLLEMAYTSIVTGTLVYFLKLYIDAPRPYQESLDVVSFFQYTGSDASFPSGHSAIFFGLALSLFLHHKKAGIVGLVGAGLIATARVLSHVHFMRDVVAGAIIGILVALLVHSIIKKYIKNKA